MAEIALKTNPARACLQKNWSERLSEKVGEQLIKAISEGRFKVGEKLPSSLIWRN